MERVTKSPAGACEYCSGKRKLYQASRSTKLYISTFGTRRTLETVANNCPPFARCSVRGVAVRSAFIINYCPHCGRELKEEVQE